MWVFGGKHFLKDFYLFFFVITHLSFKGPDYRLYKSEPELTTVAEVDESNGEEKSEPASEIETSVKGQHLWYVLSPVFSRHFRNKFSLHADRVHMRAHSPSFETCGIWRVSEFRSFQILGQ